MNLEIVELIKKMSSISLSSMDEVSLMKRCDTKFLIPTKLFPVIINELINDYAILEINQNRLMTYHSLYFDTPDFQFYHQHHNKKANRTKIRLRQYFESDLSFLEIKQKNGKGETQKTRMNINALHTKMDDAENNFILENTHQQYNLKHTLTNTFNRITLVNKLEKERVTFDFNITFQKENQKEIWSDLMVIEIKQEKENSQSSIRKVLKTLHYHPFSISKYCMGMINLYPGIKYNRFKKKILKVNQLKTI